MLIPTHKSEYYTLERETSIEVQHDAKTQLVILVVVRPKLSTPILLFKDEAIELRDILNSVLK
jgi:hypothetical protein